MRLVVAIILMFDLIGLADAAPAQRDRQTIAIGFITQHVEAPAPPSPLDVVADDEGVQGARLGLADNATTGRFTGQDFTLEQSEIEDAGGAGAAVRALAARGVRLIVADLPVDAVGQAAAAA